MCDFSNRLVAWMDGELAGAEASTVEHHVRACGDCQGRIAAYEQVSRGFAAYYTASTTADGLPASDAPRRLPRTVPRWVPVLAGAAAVAAMLLLALSQRPVKPAPLAPPTAQVAEGAPLVAPAIAPAVAPEITPKPIQPVQRHHAAARRKSPKADFAVAGPAIQSPFQPKPCFLPALFRKE